MKTRKDKLNILFQYALENEMEYIVVGIQTKGSDGIELIINPKCNFNQKQEYYNKAYNDDLILNSYDGISIVFFASANTLEEIGYLYDEFISTYKGDD